MNAISPTFPWSNPIPSSGWDILNARRLFKEVVVRSQGDEPLASATQGQGIVARSDLDIQVWNPESDTSNYKRVEPGQFVISLRSFQGGFEISNIIGMVSPAYTTLQPLKPELNVFYRHFFKSEAFISAVNSVASGIRQGKAIKFEDFASLSLPVPPVEQAQIIAAYLDRETGRIDALVERLERLIALLTEKRQAVISHAVTKGLNPDAPMKDSGIDWLGEVPAHWEVLPTKYLCSLVKDGTHLPPPRVEDGVPLLSVRNIVGGKFVNRDDDSMIAPEDYAILCKSFVPQVDDVLLAIVGGTLGKSAIIDAGMGAFHIQRSVAIFRCSDRLQPKWLHMMFQSYQFQAMLWGNVAFSAQPGIYLGTLADARITVPPILEQERTVERVEKRLKGINNAIDHSRHKVMLLKERRSALISAAVTGQIPLADMVADPAPEATA